MLCALVGMGLLHFHAPKLAVTIAICLAFVFTIPSMIEAFRECWALFRAIFVSENESL